MAEAAIGRAFLTRYPVELELQYRVLNGVRGSGRTVNLSSALIVFEPTETLPSAARIELLITWPVALNGTVGLRLWISGTIVGDQARRVTVKITRHEFRVTRLKAMTQNPEHKYRNATGLIVMCMYCRRTLRAEDQWDLVQEFLAKRPKKVSDGLCGDCLEKHFPRK